jgi:hypothetical protein
MDDLHGRSFHALQLRGSGAVAVGDGGLVMVSSGSRGTAWGAPDLQLPVEVLAPWDFHAVHGAGANIWAVGRPGSSALHSGDGGKTWETVRTGQTMPLHGIFFTDARHGWAVGEMGTILATRDGGKTWNVQHRGGQRAAVLFAHARSTGLPADTVALLGGQDGYLAASVCLTAPDPATAAPGQATHSSRFAAAMRALGGMGAEGLWQFPLPTHMARANQNEILQLWDRLHDGQAAERLMAQMVLSIRMWRPDVIVTDGIEASRGVDTMIAEGMREAVKRAADPNAYPEQIKVLGLETWKTSKLYSRSDGPGSCSVRLDLGTVSAALRSTPHDFAEGPAALLGTTVPMERRYRLLASTIPGAEGHAALFQGVTLAPGGIARRAITADEQPAEEVVKAGHALANFRGMLDSTNSKIADPNRLLGALGPMLNELPADQGAPAALAVAREFARRGEWALAREAYRLVVERFPTHPLAVDALRWLIRHEASSEARRRHEMGQFALLTEKRFGSPKDVKTPKVTDFETRSNVLLSANKQEKNWYQGCLEIGKLLERFGPFQATDPGLQFCLLSARRNLGEIARAQEWYQEFANRFPDSPWHSHAQAEMWLLNRNGAPPRPALVCQQAAERPFLDGKFDDACWAECTAMPLTVAGGDRNTLEKEYPTTVRMSYDSEFLYLAIHCAHPADRGEPAAKVRTRDGDLRAHDRISLLLDLDRDYATCFHFQVDATGCVAEDCWGDRSWNPRWFVAIHREPTAWTAEISIPLDALTADRVTSGRAWAFNVIRTLPGRGVQAFSTPAEVPEEALRPEGMGLLLFGAPQGR